ncbi:MAG: HEAT repeat domain-containing protein [Planctomycetota bacterium]|jgi:HEAT repeat protein
MAEARNEIVRSLLLSMVLGLFIQCSYCSEQQLESNVPKSAWAKEEVPVHSWHRERVENIRSETTREAIENLANFDDAHFATTGMGRHFRTGYPEDEMFRVVHLFRVRRLLEIGRRAPEKVTPVLRTALRQALADWPHALAQMQKMWADHPDGFSTEGPTKYEKNQVKAIAATYLLAELGDFNSLPLLLQSYRLHTKWISEHKHYPCTQVAAPQAITLYAMHRLVSAYPVNLLGHEGCELRESYMGWAAEQIPPASRLSGSAWNADYDESDPLGPVLDPEAAALRGQPTIQLVIYPTKFGDGEQMQDGHTQKVAERSNLWFQRLERFVEASYPEAKSHQPQLKAADVDFEGVNIQAEDENPGFMVSGRVFTEPGGKGAGGIKVRLNCYGKQWSTTTKEDGTYVFKGVRPSQYRYVLRIEHGWGVWSERIIVRIKDQDVMDKNLFVTQPQSISGTVLDAQTTEPVARADLRISTDDGDWVIVQTDADGKFLLYVKPRQVTIECNGTTYRYYPAKEAKELTVEAGEKMSNVDFEVHSAPRFTGQVIFADGEPAGGVLVNVEIAWEGTNMSSQRDASGIGYTFKLRTDEKGGFVGYLRRPKFRNWPETVKLKAIARLHDRPMGSVARAETNTNASHVEPIKIVLGESASAIIRVVDPNGKPIENAEVTASDMQADFNKHFGGPVKYLGDGRYHMTGLIPGLDYYMTAHAAGYHTEFGNAKRFVLESGQEFDAGMLTLEWWGKKAVPGLIEKLRDPDEREWAVEMLGQLGPDAVDAIPALISVLKSESRSDVRFKIASGLEEIGPAGKAMAPGLIRGLIQLLTKDPSSSVRYSIAATLGKLGPEAKAAVPYLIETLETDGEAPRREAAKALGLIGDPNAVTALEAALSDKEPPVRRAAAVALGQLGPAAVKAVPSLIKKLQNDKLLRTEAARALGLIGDVSALPALKAAQNDGSISVREAASRAIEEIEKKEKSNSKVEAKSGSIGFESC